MKTTKIIKKTMVALGLLLLGCHSDSGTSPRDTGDTDTGELDGGDVDGGTGSIELWEWCPGAEAYQGDVRWSWSIKVAETALYCGAVEDAGFSNPGGDFIKERDMKAQLRLVPGTYPIPEPGTDPHPITLPLCYRSADDTDPLLTTGIGTISVETDQIYIWNPVTKLETEETRHRYAYTTAVSNDTQGSKNIIVRFETVNYHPDAPMIMEVDGRYADNYLTEDEPAFVRVSFDTENSSRAFYPCRFFERPERENLTTVVFAGGEINLDMDIYSDLPESASTEPSAFVRAFGVFKNQSFDQNDYWKLIYSPAHHHFVQHWAVLFDKPIDGACGIAVTGYESRGQNVGLPKVASIDCEFNDLEVFEVSSASSN
jgi:hypothetical protein